MNKLAAMVTAGVFATIANVGAHAVIIEANASLDGLQVVPSTTSTATGTALVSFDTATNLLDLTATITGIFIADVTFPPGPLAFGTLGPMHIHEEAAGLNGPIVVPFPALASYTETATGLQILASGVAFNPAIIPALLDDGLYLQIHTLTASGGGEIRGQLIVPEPGTLGLLGAGLIGLAWRRRRA